MKISRFILVLTVVAFAVTGCRTSKQGALSGVKTGDWENVVMPMKLTLKGDSEMKASGRLTMIRDESVYLSVRMLGMEVFSVYAGGDSVWVYDRMSGTLAGERLGREPKSRKALTIGRLQDLMLGTKDVANVFTLNVGNLDIEISSGMQKETPYGNMTDGWRAVAGNAKMEGEVKWDLDEAKWNQEKLGEWRRPRSPKKELKGVGELLKWFGGDI